MGTFKMELSDDYYKWCVDNAPELRVLPTHPNSDDFQLQTSFIKFKDTNIKIKFSLNSSINIQNLWQVAKEFIAQLPNREMNDDMLSKSNEDLFSVPTYLKIDPETQRDVQLRLGYTTRYCEDDEIKIMVYNDFKKGEKMEIV